jgi:hypothetical protein
VTQKTTAPFPLVATFVFTQNLAIVTHDAD